MKYLYQLILLLLISVLFLPGCNEPKDASSYGSQSGRIRVTLDLNDNENQNSNKTSESLTGQSLPGLPTSTQTALIVAVPVGTTFYEDQDLVTNYEDRALVDLTTGLVTLYLPINQPLLLFEYTYNSKYSTVESLYGVNAYSTAKMGPISISSSTSQITLKAILSQSLAGGFDDVISYGTHGINVHNDTNPNVAEYQYTDFNWYPAPLSESAYNYDPTTDTWSGPVLSSDNNYEFFDGTYDTNGAVFNQLTNANIDASIFSINYSDIIAPYYPNVTIQLLNVIDLNENPTEFEIDSRGDMDKKQFNISFSRGAQAYLFKVSGMARYSLEEPEKFRDCSGDSEISTPVNSFDAFLSYNNDASHDFACKDSDHNTCLTFKNFTPGDTSGDIMEVKRNQTDYSVDSTMDIGTWWIDASNDSDRPVRMLFFDANSSDYYRDGEWSEMWAEFDDGSGDTLWRGYYSINPNPSQYFKTYNSTTLADFKNHLNTLPSTNDAFVAQSKDGDGCYQPFQFYGSSPADGDGSVDTSADIYIQFTKPLNTGSVAFASASCSGGTIAISPDNFTTCYTDISLDVTYAFEDGNRRIVVSPGSNLAGAWPVTTTIYIRIDSTLLSYVNENLGTTVNFSFTTTGP